ncbi:ATP-binding protein [Halovulum sp. GXIMD14794]
MKPPVLKYPLPRSLFPRATLIVVVPLIALQLVVGFVFVQRHFEDVTRQMTQNIAREMAVAQQVIDTSSTTEIAQLRLDNLSTPLAITFRLGADELQPGAHARDWFDLSGRALIAEMADLLGDGIQVDLADDRKRVDVRMPTEMGVLRAVIPRSRMTASNPHQLLVLMAAASLILAIIALLFLRNQMKPILQLAEAADAFGKGRSVPFRPAGADEVRRAGAAFISMRHRIERAMEQRTQMLSGVSHDLRTPLTRMKLSLALADDLPEAEEMSHDVEQMEQMLNSFLAFARGDQLDDAEEVNLCALLEELEEQARRVGHRLECEIDLGGEEAPVAMLRRAAVVRALQNLLSNAARHGTRARLSLKVAPRAILFTVEDNGPGVPEDKREEVMRPFTRLDSARNQDRGGGVGLGLAIALDVARSHGGALELGESEALGGLKAVLRLPR